MKKAKILLALLLTALFVLSALGSGESSSSSDTPVADDNVVETAAPSKELSRGTITGDTYANEFADFTFMKPTDWTFATDDEIAETINLGQDILDLSNLEQALSNTASVYDMYAHDDYGNSVMVCYENTLVSGGRTYTVDEYVSILTSNMESVESPSYTFISSEDVTFGHTDYQKLVFVGNYDGVEINQAYYITVIDNYAISIITTSATETLDSLEALLY